jgi:pimeloyl-ACP methyl ester carboxylesterase
VSPLLQEGPPDPRATWARLAGPGFAEAHPDVIEEEAQLSIEAATPLEGVMRQIMAIAQWDPKEALQGLAQRMPVAIAHGDADPLVPYVNGVNLARRLGADLVTYEGSGHVLESERADEVADLMRRTFAAAA